MIVEIITRGAFNGIGRTVPPSIIGIVFTGARVPAAMVLSLERYLGMLGIWWAISLSSVVKGIGLMGWYMAVLHRSGKDKPNKTKVHLSFLPTRQRQQIKIEEME